jgi:secondary thiamine-phosphate synthase enzyme
MWYQQTLTLSAKPRGFHLVTEEVIGQIRDLSRVRTGLLHLLLQHTSASLTLNENCDPTVRSDMENHFLKSVPDNAPMSTIMRAQMTCLRISNLLCSGYR